MSKWFSHLRGPSVRTTRTIPVTRRVRVVCPQNTCYVVRPHATPPRLARALLSHQIKLRSTNPRPPTLLPPSASMCAAVHAAFRRFSEGGFRWRLPCACNMYTCVLHVRVPPPACVTCACCVCACCPHACRTLSAAAGGRQPAVGSRQQVSAYATAGDAQPAGLDQSGLRQVRPSDRSDR